MTLVVPDPTRTVPLPLREQADVRDRWLTQRLLDLLPGLMDRAGIDLWLVVGREGSEDPVLPTLLPATWLSARRLVVLVLHRSDDGVTPVAVSRYPVGQYLPGWSPEDDGTEDGTHDADGDERALWAAVRRIVTQADPRRIGIDVSAGCPLADGLSVAEHRLLAGALGDLADRLVSAEDLVVGWLETRLPEEVAALDALARLTDRVLAEVLSPAALVPGLTTAADLAWAVRERLADLGTPPWFHPGVTVQRAGVPLRADSGVDLPAVPQDAVLEPGDLVTCDAGLSSLGLATDLQRSAYLLRPGEDAAPAGLRQAWAAGRRAQELTAAALVPGRTGNEVLADARAATAAEGLPTDVYSHPVGVHGHGAGPAIGRWDDQRGVPGDGDRVLHPGTVFAVELAVRVPVPEWDGQCLRLALEEQVVLTRTGTAPLGRPQRELWTVPAPQL
ncbi:M24 family metallopeptidase [Geodermatophilus normandii]|uniref:M24 family metallopeptidase n=1 Tax=Geodermatophilus normandii TaxID=1137989 RepID=A0A6P0GH87_9ACTN|nr:M24 family metallopeptidase [Geodermatophilus normandii]NEM06675.1 M24 family metallopeptidase [Geodermatophilus normandii]NEM08399.1 M24 family metallopeptidase [Geodermatophilus normandii]